MSIRVREWFAALAVLLAVATVAHAGGFVEPVMEPDVVVSPGEPVTDPASAAAVSAALRGSGPDRGDSVVPSSVGRAAVDRVPCFTVPAARRNGAGLFSLCQP